MKDINLFKQSKDGQQVNIEPHSIEAEQSILGSMMLLSSNFETNERQYNKIMSTVAEKTFYHRQHKMIFTALTECIKAQMPPDLIVLSEKLEEKNQLDDVGGFAYIADLVKNTPSAANVMAYCKIVKDRAISRAYIKVLEEAKQDIYESVDDNPIQAGGRAQSALQLISDKAIRNQSSGLVKMDKIASSFVDVLEERWSGTAKAGYKTGINQLDRLIGISGIESGLVVAGGRPSMGKTALMNSFVDGFADNQEDEAVLVFSLEMTTQSIFERMILSKSKARKQDLYQCDDDVTMARISQAVGDSIAKNIYIDDTSNIDIDYIARGAREIAKDQSISLIAIDYLTLMKFGDAERNDLAVSAMTRALKTLSKELNCVILLLSQLNRSLEQRSDKRPVNSDLRDSGGIEQDADIILMLYREGVYNEEMNDEDRRKTELLVRKNRDGELGTCYLNLRNAYFEECDPFHFETKKAAKYDKRDV